MSQNTGRLPYAGDTEPDVNEAVHVHSCGSETCVELIKTLHSTKLQLQSHVFQLKSDLEYVKKLLKQTEAQLKNEYIDNKQIFESGNAPVILYCCEQCDGLLPTREDYLDHILNCADASMEIKCLYYKCAADMFLKINTKRKTKTGPDKQITDTATRKRYSKRTMEKCLKESEKPRNSLPHTESGNEDGQLPKKRTRRAAARKLLAKWGVDQDEAEELSSKTATEIVSTTVNIKGKFSPQNGKGEYCEQKTDIDMHRNVETESSCHSEAVTVSTEFRSNCTKYLEDLECQKPIIGTSIIAPAKCSLDHSNDDDKGLCDLENTATIDDVGATCSKDSDCANNSKGLVDTKKGDRKQNARSSIKTGEIVTPNMAFKSEDTEFDEKDSEENKSCFNNEEEAEDVSKLSTKASEGSPKRKLAKTQRLIMPGSKMQTSQENPQNMEYSNQEIKQLQSKCLKYLVKQDKEESVSVSETCDSIYQCPKCTFCSKKCISFHRHIATHDIENSTEEWDNNLKSVEDVKKDCEEKGDKTTGTPSSSRRQVYKQLHMEWKKLYEQYEVLEDNILKHYQCPSCDYKTSSCGHFGRHFQNVHNLAGDEGRDLWRCDVCEFETQKKAIYMQHKKSHEKPYLCNYCPRRFGSQKSLSDHIMVHTGTQPLKCPHCDYATIQKRCLQEHVRKHTGETLLCSSCTFTTVYQSAMTKHTLSKHTKKGLHHCLDCDYITNDRTSLLRHVQTHQKHKEFKCCHCNYEGVTKHEVIRHMRCHTQEKVYYCDRCDFSTAYPGALRTHLMMHLDLKPFKCSFCGYSASQKMRVHNHIQAKHKQNTAVVLDLGIKLNLDLKNFRRKSEVKQEYEVFDRDLQLEEDDQNNTEAATIEVVPEEDMGSVVIENPGNLRYIIANLEPDSSGTVVNVLKPIDTGEDGQELSAVYKASIQGITGSSDVSTFAVNLPLTSNNILSADNIGVASTDVNGQSSTKIFSANTETVCFNVVVDSADIITEQSESQDVE